MGYDYETDEMIDAVDNDISKMRSKLKEQRKDDLERIYELEQRVDFLEKIIRQLSPVNFPSDF